MAKRNYYPSSNNPLSGCVIILAIIGTTISAIFQWIKENPTLTVMLLIGISIILLSIAYLLKVSKNKEQKDINAHKTIMDSIPNKNDTYSQESIYVEPDENIIPTEETFLSNQYNETILDITSCSKSDICTLAGFNNKKADKFIKERFNGKMWYDIDSFVKDFDLQPHEMIMVQSRIKFPERPKNKYGRRIDI